MSRSTVQKLENNMMNIVCQSCKQILMHRTERIFNALHTKTSIHHLSIGGWFNRMKLIEVKSLIWAQKGILYIIYENVMWIQWPTIPVWWQKKGIVLICLTLCLHISSNEPQQKPTFSKPIIFIDWYEKKVYKQW